MDRAVVWAREFLGNAAFSNVERIVYTCLLDSIF